MNRLVAAVLVCAAGDSWSATLDGAAADSTVRSGADAATGEPLPHVPEQIYVDADTVADVRLSIASVGDVAAARGAGFVLEGSGCRCRVAAAPPASSNLLPGVIGIVIARVIRRRRQPRTRQ